MIPYRIKVREVAKRARLEAVSSGNCTINEVATIAARGADVAADDSGYDSEPNFDKFKSELFEATVNSM